MRFDILTIFPQLLASPLQEGIIRRAVASGEVYGKVPLFLYDKTEAGSTYRKTLTDMVLQEYVRLVRSQDFDRDWHDFVRRWYEAGGEEMTLERNAEPPR